MVMAETDTDNIFEIPDCESWYCRVVAYERTGTESHLQLELMRSGEPPLFLHFHGVTYFTGWMSWKGVGFRVGSEDELLGFVLSSTRAYDDMSASTLLGRNMLGGYCLFSCEGAYSTQINIVASRAYSADAKGKILVAAAV